LGQALVTDGHLPLDAASYRSNIIRPGIANIAAAGSYVNHSPTTSDGPQLAAEQGHARAQFNLGVTYAKGRGVPQDDKQAVKWFRLAADQGHAKAQYNLALMYDNGEGVPQDYVQAHMWLNLAAANGDENAKENRDIAAGLMTSEEIAEAQKLAREWMAAHPDQ
jgi:TPR repeat protein